jgi:hypothetical protein
MEALRRSVEDVQGRRTKAPAKTKSSGNGSRRKTAATRKSA